MKKKMKKKKKKKKKKINLNEINIFKIYIMNINILGYKVSVMHLLLAGILIAIINSSTTCGCMKCSVKDAFTLIVDSNKPVTKIRYDDYKEKSNPYSVNKLNERKVNSDLMWANNEFSKDCCVNNQSNYYNRAGCVCPTEEQLNHLSKRGGNHK